VGPLRSDYEREMAAVLACGDTAIVSHRSAASMWKLLRPLPAEIPVEISIQGTHRIPGPSVRVHRVAGIEEDETTRLQGIRVTAPARTIFDLAGSVAARKVEQVLAVAIRERLTTEKEIERLLTRYPRRPGRPLLRTLLETDSGPALTRSEAESRFLQLLRKSRLPRPRANVPVEGYEVDFLWLRERLIVEVDGFAYHSSSGAFERDRRRDAVLAGAGFRVVRITWRQLTKEPEALLVNLTRALSGTSR